MKLKLDNIIIVISNCTLIIEKNVQKLLLIVIIHILYKNIKYLFTHNIKIIKNI